MKYFTKRKDIIEDLLEINFEDFSPNFHRNYK